MIPPKTLISSTDCLKERPEEDQGRAADQAFAVRLPSDLYAEVERVCALLSCSKRRFLEMAVLSALDKSEQIFMETFHEAHGQEFTTVYAPKGDE